MNDNCGIYFLKWNNCDYFYIGQSYKLNKREVEHERHLRKNRHDNSRLQNIYNKYGKPLFIIVELCEESKLIEREQYFLDLLFEQDNCLNLSPTASAQRGFKWSDESKEKMRLIRTGTISPKKGIKVSREIVEKQRRSLINGGKMKGENNPFYNKKHSQESIDKIKVGSIKRTGGNNGRARKVLDTETGITFNSVIEVADLFNYNINNLRYKLSSKNNNTPFIYLDKCHEKEKI